MNLQENIHRIKEVMGLNEVAENIDNIYPFEYYPPASHEYNPVHHYSFDTETQKYNVRFFEKYPKKYYPDGTYERDYMTYDMGAFSGIEPISDKSMTNEHKALKVNATVMAITIDWIERTPDFYQLIITPVDERRLNLVKRFCDNTLGGKYDILVDSMPGLYNKSVIIRSRGN